MASSNFAQAARAVASGGVIRIVGIPLTGLFGLLNTGLIIANTGEVIFGLVSTIATLGTLMPFADLGMGVTVTTAVAIAKGDPSKWEVALATIWRALLRLLLVSAVGIAAVWGATVLGVWDTVLNHPFTAREATAVGIALSLFFLIIPLGLGARVLVGLDLNHVAVAVQITATGWALLTTWLMSQAGIHGIPYAISGFAGNMAANIILAALALRFLSRAGVRLSDMRPASQSIRGQEAGKHLLAGSGWMLVVMAGLPIGLETGRLVLTHSSSRTVLSQFALGAQLYALSWSILSTGGQALWAIFARQRKDSEGSQKMWRISVAMFGMVALVGGALLVWIGPWLGTVISQGDILVPRTQMVAFALLLFVQAIHLPGGVLLTRPEELRWQAMCIIAMALISITISISLSPIYGGLAVTGGAAIAVFVAQFIPDLVMVPRFLVRRPEVTESSRT